MKLKYRVLIALLSAVTFVSSSGIAQAEWGIFNSFVQMNGSTWYSMGTSSPSFQGASLGSFTDTDSLTITGAEVNTWKSGSGDVTAAYFNYRIYRVGDTAPSFTEVQRFFTENANFNDAHGTPITGSGDQKWADGALNVDVLSFAGDTGTYNIEVFARATGNNPSGSAFWSDNGNNYTATFDWTAPLGNGNGNGNGGPGGVSAIPEPGTMVLMALGFVAVMGRRYFAVK